MSRAFTSPCYCTNARRIANILTEKYNEKLRPFDLNTAQFCLLRNLERIERGNLTEWAEATGIERTTMVRNAKGLAEAGLITRTEGRGVVYTLSEKGRNVMAEAVPRWQEAQDQIHDLLGPEDTEALLRIGRLIQKL